MTIPFPVEQCYGVFTANNIAVWPMQLPLSVQLRSYSTMGISGTLTASELMK